MAALAYDPNQTCGFYGGRNAAGLPCKHPAGHYSTDDSGRCREHDRVAEAFRAAKKAQILELLPEIGNSGQVCKAAGVTPRTVWAWRQEDAEFREEYDALVTARDRSRAADVEDKVYERIMGDKASPAETIFFLKNRDPDRWKDVFENKGRGPIMGAGQPLPEIDSAKGKLSHKLKEQARRMAQASRTSESLTREAQAAEAAAREAIQHDTDGDE